MAQNMKRDAPSKGKDARTSAKAQPTRPIDRQSIGGAKQVRGKRQATSGRQAEGPLERPCRA